jgi:hypothetical protein
LTRAARIASDQRLVFPTDPAKVLSVDAYRATQDVMRSGGMLDNDVDVNKASTPVICKKRPNEAANKATTGERAPWSPLPAGLTSVVHAHDVEAAAAVGAGPARERWLTTKVSDVSHAKARAYGPSSEPSALRPESARCEKWTRNENFGVDIQ